jgi:hypothetical protein
MFIPASYFFKYLSDAALLELPAAHEEPLGQAV